MEFSETLQNLRHQKGLTQQQLADALHVSRTAVSKWESGRGYPGIDSLKAIAAYFSVSIDSLLTGSEAIGLMQEEHRRKTDRQRNLLFGLTDLSMAMLLFLPLFGQAAAGGVLAVPLIQLRSITPYLQFVYYALVVFGCLCGLAMVCLCRSLTAKHQRLMLGVSFGISILGALVFIFSHAPYAAAFLLMHLVIKAGICQKQR